ncbi:MAG: type IV secretory system conjugative DNA transfer family protein [Cohaesibacter sp.]|nr:type IV secretory system conjugative DNA transfer family protein [Cohaesibacter sp.]
MQDARLIGNEPSEALQFGSFEEGDEALVWAGESHLLTVAPTRTGKGTTQIIPNLLSYKGSCIILDPKGELYDATADWRRKNVGPVHVLNPFELDAVGTHTNALNPLDLIETDHDVTKLAEMIYPRTSDDRQKFFDNEAIGFLSAVLLFSAKYAPPSHRNLGTIRDTISSLNKDFYGLTKAMASDGMPNAIRNAAANVLSKTRDVGLPRLIDSLGQHMRIWDTEGLRKATSQSDFDFKSLKDKPSYHISGAAV